MSGEQDRDRPTEAQIQRFWSRVSRTETCWLWTGALTYRGYGTMWAGKSRPVPAHRFAFALLRERPPDDMVLDHICRVRHCVNPDHLRVVSNKENVLAGIGPTAINARKTHCPSGHEYSPENTRITKEGYRRCITCRTTPVTCPECGASLNYSNIAEHRRRQHAA